MGLDRPGITPTRKPAKRKPPVRPQTKPKRKPAAAAGGVFGPQGRTGEASTPAAVRRPVRTAPGRSPRPTGRRPKVDTGNILTPAERRTLRAQAPTRTVTVRGRGGRTTRVTVDTGNILEGAGRATPAEERRVAAARRRARPSFGEALQDEFLGTGAVGQLVSRSAPRIARALVGSDNDTIVYKGRRVPVAKSGIAQLGVTDGGRKVITDAVNLPKDAIAALYEAGAASVEAAGGDTKRGKRLIAGLDEGALGRLVVHGDPKGAARVAKEHPLFAALEVTGAGQIVGRGAGAVARAGAVGRRAKAGAGTKRAPLRVEGTNQRVERRYSPNVIVKGVQVANERGKRKRGFDPNVARGQQRSRILNAEVDEFAAQAEGIRRRGREEVARQAAKIAPVRAGAGATSRTGRARAAADRARSRGLEASGVPGARGRAERHVVLAAVEGRLRGPKTFVPDVKRERARLQAVYVAERANMSAAARKANREQVAALDRVLTDPKARAAGAEVFRAADEYNAVAGKLERELIRKGALNKDQAEHARLRTYGVSVMGLRPSTKARAPEHLEQRHAEAVAAASTARQLVTELRAKESKARTELDRATGSARTARAAATAKRGKQRAYYVGKERFTDRGEADRRARQTRQKVRIVALNVREAERTGRVNQLARRHAQAKRARKAAEAAAVKARKDADGSAPNKYISGLEDADGNPVATAQIREHIEAHGNREPGFVGHRRSDRGAASYFVNWFGGRKTVDSKKRTGEAARTGGYDASFAALEEQLVRGRGVADAIGTFDDFVGRFGTKRRDGSPFTWAEAERSAGELGEATGMEWLPVRAVPARYDDATRASILESQGSASTPGHLESLTLGRLDDSMRPPTGKERLARNVVLVPAQQLQRFSAHQTAGSSTGAKVGQAATRAFRNTVLPFSTKWLTGNVAEATLRSAAAGVTPGDLMRGRRVMNSLKGLDEAAWRAADTRIRGGLLYGSAERLNVRRGAEDMKGTVLHAPAVGVGQVARMPVVRQTLAGLRVYTQAVMGLNRGLERAFQTGVIGKQARIDAQELTGSWAKAVRMQEDVAREVARGLLGTPKQVQFARAADQILGKYSRFSPGTRRTIQTFAPFLPWFLNAGRFVYHTLPARHPAKTALLANIEMTLQDDIEAHRKSVPPGELESAIRRKDGGLVNLARYTPFGAFTKGAVGLVDPLLPQIDSAAEALKGRSFTGKELRLESGEPAGEGKKLWLAFYTLLEGAVPGIQIARRVREKGGSAFDDSNVLSPKVRPRKKTDPSAANRILNPLRPTYLSGGPSSGGGAAPASAAEEAEARAILREMQGNPAEQEALDREARAILRELEAAKP